MHALTIGLIDLNGVTSASLVEQLRAIFDTGDNPFQLQCASDDGARSNFQPEFSSQQPDVLLLVLPEVLTDSDRTSIRIFRKELRAPIIAVLNNTGTDELMELFTLGVTDFITPPLRTSDMMPRLLRLTDHVRKKNSVIERLKETIGLRQIIGKSRALTAELQKIPFVAGCDSSVLISGETGTGKEMFARAIHYLGPRADKPFTPVNCGAIPTDLIENELFGHTKGAFTSAVISADGLIQQTDGGTLFLDEIDCLALSAQVKLLRFLQEKEYRQLGSAKTKRADVRIIAATNIDLGLAAKQGSFRRDLYYRLNIIPLALPPLRERRDDIPILVNHFVERYALELSKEVDEIAPDAMQKLLLYDWPGNVRELQNVVERAVVFSSVRILHRNDLNLPETETASSVESFQQAKARVIVQFEKNYISSLLSAHKGNITRAAKTAGKNRRAFWELMRKYEIDTGKYRFRD